MIHLGLLLAWRFYSESQATFQWAIKTGIPRVERLESSCRKIYGRYGDLIQHYEVSLLRMLD